MQLYGKEYHRSELEKLVPDIHQIMGTRHYELTEGATRGTRVIDVNTGNLKYSIVPDRGLDISLVSYKGINLTHLTENGEVNPAFYESHGTEWARIFFGGLMTTCGLSYLGPPGKDGTEELGLHGRYSAIPAKNVRDESGWIGDEYRIRVTGMVQETIQMGTKLHLFRTIESFGGNSRITITDTVRNAGSHASPFTILYHINFGFPLLNSGSIIRMQAKKMIPFDGYSAGQQKGSLTIGNPQLGYLEENYLCPVAVDENGYSYALIVNEDLADGLGVYIRSSAETLPYFCYWKMLDERDYIVAIEPANVCCENRFILRNQGMLPVLNPGEERVMQIEIGILEGKKTISDFVNGKEWVSE